VISSDDLARLLAARLKKYRHSLVLVTRFTDSAPSTIKGWMDGSHPAKGERLNSLWHFLAAAGFDSPELAEVDVFGRYVGQLLAYRVIDMSNALEVCGVKNPQAVFDVIRGNRTPANPSVTYEELVELYGEQLQAAIDKLRQELGITSNTGVSQDVPEPELEQHPAATPVVSPVVLPGVGTGDRELFLLGAARHLSDTLALVRYLAEHCPPEERSRLREFMGVDAMFELSNLINGLCGERANAHRR